MKKALGFVVFMVLVNTLFAQDIAKEPIKLTVDKSVKMALENNLSFKMTTIDKRAAERKKNTLWNKYIPSISGTFGIVYSDQLFSKIQDDVDLTGYNNAYTPGLGSILTAMANPDIDPWTMTMGIDISLPLNMESFTNISKTRHDFDAGVLTYEQAEKELILNIKKAFYGLLATKANQVLFEKNLQMVEKQYAQALANYRSGLLAEVELLKAQVGLENMKPSLTKMKNAYENQEMLFKMLLGIDKNIPIKIEGDLNVVMKDFNNSYILSHFMGNRLDAQILSSTIQSLKATELGTWGLTRTPTLITSMTWGSNINNFDDADKWKEDSWSDSFGLNFILSVPIDGWIPGTKTDVQLKEIHDQIQKLELSLEMTYENGGIEVSRLVNNLNASKDVADALKLNVALATRTYWLTNQSYNAGTQQYLDVENAQTALFEAEQNVLLENYTYISTLLELENALNTKVEDLIEKSEKETTSENINTSEKTEE